MTPIPRRVHDRSAAGTVFVEGSSIPISATIIDDEAGVKQASASIDGVSVAMTQDAQHPTIWTGTLAAPDVDGTADVPKTIAVTASDFENNAPTPATVSINVRPIIDALAPAVAWTCATPGAMYPSAAIAKLQVLATPASGDSITAVNMTITDSAGARIVPMTSAGGGSYTYDYTLPAVTTDASVALRAVATTLAGKSSGLPGSLTIIAPGPNVFTLAANTVIAAADTTYEGKTVLVTGGKLTIIGKHTFARLAVLNGATHRAYWAARSAPTPPPSTVSTSPRPRCSSRAADRSTSPAPASLRDGRGTTPPPAQAAARRPEAMAGPAASIRSTASWRRPTARSTIRMNRAAAARRATTTSSTAAASFASNRLRSSSTERSPPTAAVRRTRFGRPRAAASASIRRRFPAAAPCAPTAARRPSSAAAVDGWPSTTAAQRGWR